MQHAIPQSHRHRFPRVPFLPFPKHTYDCGETTFTPPCSCSTPLPNPPTSPPTCAVAPIDNQTTLYSTLADGTSELKVVVTTGTYTCDTDLAVPGNNRSTWVPCTGGDSKCGTCAGYVNPVSNSQPMYVLRPPGRFGSISCIDDLECVLNGQQSRSVMKISGFNLILRGFVFSNGYSLVSGAGLEIATYTIITIEISEFRSNHVENPDLGGAVFASSGRLNLFAVKFASNSAIAQNGTIINIQSANATSTQSQSCRRTQSTSSGSWLQTRLKPAGHPRRGAGDYSSSMLLTKRRRADRVSEKRKGSKTRNLLSGV